MKPIRFAGGMTSKFMRVGVVSAFLIAAGAAQAEHIWWNYDPLLQKAQARLFRVEGVREVAFHQYVDGAFYPHLGVSMQEFSMAQQRRVCEIVWKQYNVSAVFEYENYLFEGDGWNRFDCADVYPELRPRVS